MWLLPIQHVKQRVRALLDMWYSAGRLLSFTVPLRENHVHKSISPLVNMFLICFFLKYIFSVSGFFGGNLLKLCSIWQVHFFLKWAECVA